MIEKLKCFADEGSWDSVVKSKINEIIDRINSMLIRDSLNTEQPSQEYKEALEKILRLTESDSLSMEATIDNVADVCAKILKPAPLSQDIGVEEIIEELIKLDYKKMSKLADEDMERLCKKYNIKAILSYIESREKGVK